MTEIAAQMSAWVTIRHVKLPFNQDYVFKLFKRNEYFLPSCYVLHSIITGDQADILITNVADEAAKIFKNICIDTMESFHNYSSVNFWQAATDDLALHMRILPPMGHILREPLTPLSSSAPSASTSMFFIYKGAQVVSTAKEKIKEKVGIKPTESATVNINTTDDITLEQVHALRKILEKHETLFSDKLRLAKEPEEDWMHITLFSGAEREIKPERPYRLGLKEKKLVDEVFDE